jgi:hypothetical protein
MSSPADLESVVVELLELITTPYALSEGRSLFRGPPVEAPCAGMPTTAVFVLGTGGVAGTCQASLDVQQTTLQITVRVDHTQYSLGKALARQCWMACHRAEVEGWTTLTVREPDPAFLGRRPYGSAFVLEWVLNVEGVRLSDQTTGSVLSQPAMLQVTALPTPSAAYRGRSVLLLGNGTTAGDAVYCCELGLAGYSWIAL